MTDIAPAASAYAAFSTAATADGEQLAESVARRLGMAMPAACVSGVAANVRLLATHWATLHEAPSDD